jgi:hypothetical protein
MSGMRRTAMFFALFTLVFMCNDQLRIDDKKNENPCACEYWQNNNPESYKKYCLIVDVVNL